MLRATCSADFHRRYQGHESFRGVQKKTYRDQENVCSRHKCQPRVTFDAPKPDARTTFNKDGEKHGQREILESRDIRQVPNKRRVEVQSQNRDSLIRDVCACLALWAMRASKHRREEFYDPARKDNILRRKQTRLELWEEHHKDPIIVLDKALKCQEKPYQG